MFEIVDLYEGENCASSEKTNEAEMYGGPTAGHIKFKPLLDWMRKVRADQNAQYLKCLDWRTSRVDVNNIVDIVCSESIVHKTETFANAVKIAFKQESAAPAMTIGDAADLFEAIAAKCEENGIDLNEVEVFVANEQDKLTYFSWYYDEGTDTAVIIKNMSPRKAAEFLKNGAEAVLVKAAKSSKTMDSLIDELQKIKDQMEKLKGREDAVYKQMEEVPLSESEDDDKGDDEEPKKPVKKLAKKPAKK